MKNNYYVEAHTSSSSISEEIEAADLEQLARFVRETFAYINGCHDTSDVDVSWIKFEYDLVEGEDGNDLTADASKCI